jgi:hypothetical protein
LAFVLDPAASPIAVAKVVKLAPAARIEDDRLLVAAPDLDDGDRQALIERLLLALAA